VAWLAFEEPSVLSFVFVSPLLLPPSPPSSTTMRVTPSLRPRILSPNAHQGTSVRLITARVPKRTITSDAKRRNSSLALETNSNSAHHEASKAAILHGKHTNLPSFRCEHDPFFFTKKHRPKHRCAGELFSPTKSHATLSPSS